VQRLHDDFLGVMLVLEAIALDEVFSAVLAAVALAGLVLALVSTRPLDVFRFAMGTLHFRSLSPSPPSASLESQGEYVLADQKLRGEPERPKLY
jgi:hypothetical protein